MDKQEESCLLHCKVLLETYAAQCVSTITLFSIFHYSISTLRCRLEDGRWNIVKADIQTVVEGSGKLNSGTWRPFRWKLRRRPETWWKVISNSTSALALHL